MKAVIVILLLLSNLSQAGVMRDSYLQSPLLIGQGTHHFLWWERKHLSPNSEKIL